MAASVLDWNLAKLIRIENGAIPVSKNDSRVHGARHTGTLSQFRSRGQICACAHRSLNSDMTTQPLLYQESRSLPRPNRCLTLGYTTCAAAISASRPATACRYRYDAAGEACPSLLLRHRVGTVAVDTPLAISTAMRQHGVACRFDSKGSLMGLLDTLKGLVGRHKDQADEGVDKVGNRAEQEADGTSPRLSDVDSEEESELDIEEDSHP